MSNQLPIVVSSFLAFLTEECGLTIESQRTESSAFDNTVIVFRRKELGVRVVRDRGEWSIQIRSGQRSDDWYDAALLKEHITRVESQDAVDFEEQAKFVRTSWNDIANMLTGPHSNETLAALEQRSQEWTKRWLSKWKD